MIRNLVLFSFSYNYVLIGKDWEYLVMHALRTVRAYLRDSVTILFQIFEKLLWIPISFFVPVRVINPPRELRSVIITPNHETIFDPWITLLSLPWKTFLSGLPYVIIGKTEFRPGSVMNHWYMKLIRRFMYWGNDVIPVTPTRAMLRKTLTALQKGRVLLMFPEGHTRATREDLGDMGIIGKMEEGVLVFSQKSGAPLWPVGIEPNGSGWKVSWAVGFVPVLSLMPDRKEALRYLEAHLNYLRQYSPYEQVPQLYKEA